VLPPIEALKLAKNKLKEGKTAEEVGASFEGVGREGCSQNESAGGGDEP
jgi:hypothetical protein